MTFRYACAILLALAGFGLSHAARAQEAGSSAELETQKKLANPVSSLTLIPFQFNLDRNIGPKGEENGWRVTTNIQPVVPIKLGPDWTLVVRTILPVIDQHRIFPGAGSQFGLGDTTQSFFFVPNTVNGFTWGAGPVFLYPTGTSTYLTQDQWGAGPTIVALQQTGPWTAGILANHIWGNGAKFRPTVDATYLQPFLAYAAEGGWTYTLNTESTYNWTAKEWTVPINAMVSKLTRIGDLPVSLQAGLRWYAASPDVGPRNLGGRLAVTFIVP